MVIPKWTSENNFTNLYVVKVVHQQTGGVFFEDLFWAGMISWHPKVIYFLLMVSKSEDYFLVVENDFLESSL